MSCQGRSQRRAIELVLLFAVILLGRGINRAAADTDVRPSGNFEWNVLLTDWWLVGPFPMPQPDGDGELPESGVDIVFTADEASLFPRPPVQHDGQEYAWQRW